MIGIMEDKFLDIKEAAKFLKMSVVQINRLIRRGDIPSYKAGGRRLFDREELIEWVKSKKDERYRKG